MFTLLHNCSALWTLPGPLTAPPTATILITSIDDSEHGISELLRKIRLKLKL